MIKLTLSHLLSKKNRLLIISYYFLLVLSFLITLPIFINKSEIYLNVNYYKEVFNELLFELIKLLLAIFTILIVTDHYQAYLNNVTTYKNRLFVILSKIVTYLYVITINVLITVLLYYLMLNIFDLRILEKITLIKFLITCLFDNTIITLIILLVVRTNNKMFSYLILIYYYLSIIVYSKQITIFYYLLPIHSYYYLNNNFKYLYLLFYIISLILINIIRYINEAFINN